MKTGSDIRRVNSKEALRRLFQMSDQLHADLSGQDKRMNELLREMRKNPNATRISESTVKRYIQRLKAEGNINREGSDKTGHWEVLK